MLVLLGSSSKSRRTLLYKALPEGMKLYPCAISPDIDEKAIRFDCPKKMVQEIAIAKGRELMKWLQTNDLDDIKNGRPVVRDANQKLFKDLKKPDILVTSDTVIVHEGEVREKAISNEQCKRFLQSYGITGSPAECVAGVTVTHVKCGRMFTSVSIAKQFFKPIPDEVVQRVLERGEIMNCAGGFMVEDVDIAPFLNGTEGEIENVMGMPIKVTNDLLKQCLECDCS